MTYWLNVYEDDDGRWLSDRHLTWRSAHNALFEENWCAGIRPRCLYRIKVKLKTP